MNDQTVHPGKKVPPTDCGLCLDPHGIIFTFEKKKSCMSLQNCAATCSKRFLLGGDSRFFFCAFYGMNSDKEDEDFTLFVWYIVDKRKRTKDKVVIVSEV